MLFLTFIGFSIENHMRERGYQMECGSDAYTQPSRRCPVASLYLVIKLLSGEGISVDSSRYRTQQTIYI